VLASTVGLSFRGPVDSCRPQYLSLFLASDGPIPRWSVEASSSPRKTFAAYRVDHDFRSIAQDVKKLDAKKLRGTDQGTFVAVCGRWGIRKYPRRLLQRLRGNDATNRRNSLTVCEMRRINGAGTVPRDLGKDFIHLANRSLIIACPFERISRVSPVLEDKFADEFISRGQRT